MVADNYGFKNIVVNYKKKYRKNWFLLNHYLFLSWLCTKKISF